MPDPAVPSNRRLDTEIMEAWREAAKDLGIRVEIPFTLTTSDGHSEVYEGRVLEFGGPKGLVFGSLDGNKTTWKHREDAGYAWSDLSSSYQTYNREHFIATLDDWGWFGEKGQEPDWYSGKPWS